MKVIYNKKYDNYWEILLDFYLPVIITKSFMLNLESLDVISLNNSMLEFSFISLSISLRRILLKVSEQDIFNDNYFCLGN